MKTHNDANAGQNRQKTMSVAMMKSMHDKGKYMQDAIIYNELFII